ncbi:sensor histidine kinase [soil metagenome]
MPDSLPKVGLYSRAREWVRTHPSEADGAFAAVVAVLATVGVVTGGHDPDLRDPDALALLLAVLPCVALAARRRRPVLVVGLTFAAQLATWLADYDGDNPSAVTTLVAMYTLAAYSPRRRAVVVGLVAMLAMLAVLAAGLLTDEAEGLGPVDFAGNIIVFGAAWVLGDSVHNRRAHLAVLEERAEVAERRREEEARLAVVAERARIARELHDVVAHGVSVMVLQAGGARSVLDSDPEAAAEAMRSIEAVGRSSLTELRRLLGVLRRSGDGTDLAPQPGVVALADLVESTRQAGLPVDLVVEGAPRPLATGMDLSVYRIVQEALTNALKHAGPAAAEVHLRYGADDLVVEVLDDGRGAAVDAANGSGHGLVGMRERARLFGGDLSAGLRAGGGYVVRARLPLEVVS